MFVSDDWRKKAHKGQWETKERDQFLGLKLHVRTYMRVTGGFWSLSSVASPPPAPLQDYFMCAQH